jgi:hypothetical protein
MSDGQLYLAIGLPVFGAFVGYICIVLQVNTINARITSLEATVNSRFNSLESGLTRIWERRRR